MPKPYDLSAIEFELCTVRERLHNHATVARMLAGALEDVRPFIEEVDARGGPNVLFMRFPETYRIYREVRTWYDAVNRVLKEYNDGHEQIV